MYLIGLALAAVATFPVLSAAEDALCDTFQSYTTWPYIFNNNAWGKDDTGEICTYVPDSSSHAFYAIWKWTGASSSVKAYPNIEFKSTDLPLPLEKLQSLRAAASWSLSPLSLEAGASTDPNDPVNAAAIAANGVQASVVMDVFADKDSEKSQTPSKQDYEFMIWMGQFGSSALPLGNRKEELLNPPIVVRIDDTDFKLYKAENSRGQEVFSWVADSILTSFDMDFAPLLGYLANEKMVPSDIFLGNIHFGIETFYAASEMNFSVNTFDASLETTDGSKTGTGELPVGTNVEKGSGGRLQVPVFPTPPLLGWTSGAAMLSFGVLFGFVVICL